MVRPIVVFRALKQMGLDCSYSDVKRSLDKLQNKIEDLIKRRMGEYKIELWDGVELNGVPGDEIRRRYKMRDGQNAYVIKKNGRAIIFQPHGPDGETITAENYLDIGNRQLMDLVISRSMEDIVEMVIDDIFG